MSEIKVIFALPGREFSGRFLSCWTELLNSCQQNGISAGLSQRYSSNVYYVRNLCLGGNSVDGVTQKPFGGKVDYDYIMWIDSDIYFRPEQFFRLLEADKDIISGLYIMDDNIHYATVEDWDEKYYINNGNFRFLQRQDVKKKGKLFKVDYTGFGWMLIKKGVFESMEYPWFEPYWSEFKTNKTLVKEFTSEDVSFCKRAQKNGYDIWIDPTVIVGHEKNMILI